MRGRGANLPTMTRRRTIFASIFTVAAVIVGAIVVPAAVSAIGGQTSANAGPSLTIRKDVKNLTPAEKRSFIKAIKKAKLTPDPDNPSMSRFDVFVNWHRDAFMCKNAWQQNGNAAGAAHNSPTFLPWHRQYLDEYEEMLREVSDDPNLALPYWNWTDPDSTAAVFAADFMGGNGDPVQDYAVTDGPFRKGAWEITIQDPMAALKGVQTPKNYLVRNFGAFLDQQIALPTKADVAQAVGVHRYDHKPFDANSPDAKSFRNTLEGWRDANPGECNEGWLRVNEQAGAPHVLHNAVHIYTGGIWKVGDEIARGTMVYNTSPNDPVFFIHHANIDRIWADWERAQREHYRPQKGAEKGWNGTDTMWPWKDRNINSWFGTARNGYIYETLR
jgi:tyrosinase